MEDVSKTRKISHRKNRTQITRI